MSFIENLDKYDIYSLYYMSHIGAVPSILAFGIFPFKDMESIPRLDISDKKIQWRRKNRVLPDGSHLHDHVPLYFATHTPMQYVVSFGSRSYHNQIGQENLAIFEMAALDIFQIEGLYFTDGNAASSRTKFYEELDDLKYLDWDIIKNVKRCMYGEYKRLKAAEVLCPIAIHPTLLERVIVYCEETKKIINILIKKLLDKYPNLEKDKGYLLETPIEVDNSYFFRR